MTSQRETSSQQRPIIFGEVLYDTFPDDAAVLGGAPFNVAWHLQGFGLQPLFISRVGTDELGAQVIADMQAWGMDLRGVQRDEQHPTGRVVVSFHHHEPRFDIIADQAYDHIDADQATTALQGANGALLYHGSLIARSKASRAALTQLRHHCRLPTFVDINLRPPHSQTEFVQQSFTTARWVKLNEHELATVMECAPLQGAALREAAIAFRARHDLALLVVTRGADGAWLLGEDTTIEVKPVDAGEVVDSVGAGDAFSAVTILGLQHRWSWSVLGERAVDFAAAVCRLRGATTPDQALYGHYINKWGL